MSERTRKPLLLEEKCSKKKDREFDNVFLKVLIRSLSFILDIRRKH